MRVIALERERSSMPDDFRKLGHLTIRSRRDRATYVVALSGELDMASAPGVEEEMQRAGQTDAATVVVDLSRLEFIDSTGIRTLIEANRTAQGNGRRLEVRRAPERVQRIFQLAGVDRLLPFVD